jgi:hypothetical protein
MKNNPYACAYKRMCKGVCSSPSSCIMASKTEAEYWSEIQEAMVAKANIDRIKANIDRINHYITTIPWENVKKKALLHWSTLR